MIANPQPNSLTPQDYLDWEKHQDIKYEYINIDGALRYALLTLRLNHLSQ